jgi:hypothetical protein
VRELYTAQEENDENLILIFAAVCIDLLLKNTIL